MTNGAVTRVSRIGSDNTRWEVEIDPVAKANPGFDAKSHPPVTVWLSAASSCGGPTSICAGGGDGGDLRPLYGTTTAIVAGPPLTARFRDVPATHDGASDFSFTVDFSEFVRDAARRHFSVVNGQWSSSTRLDAATGARTGRDSFSVSITPSGESDVGISMPVPSHCSPGACTPDGRRLSNSPRATVRHLGREPAGFGARFEDVPARHASEPFTFVLVFEFGEDIEAAGDATLAAGTDVAAAFTVTEATLTAAREDPGSDRRWTITVTPRSAAAVTIELPATSDCNDAGAICTAVGDRLEEANEATVEGPLTARFRGVPARHVFEPFTFVLEFSADVELADGTDVAGAFTVGGATLTAAREAEGSDRRWVITVTPLASPDTPGSAADVTIELPATSDCSDEGAVCTTTGDRLGGTVEATVRAALMARFLDVPERRGIENGAEVRDIAFTVEFTRRIQVRDSVLVLSDDARTEFNSFSYFFEVEGGELTDATLIRDETATPAYLGPSDQVSAWYGRRFRVVIRADEGADTTTFTLPAQTNCNHVSSAVFGSVYPLCVLSNTREWLRNSPTATVAAPQRPSVVVSSSSPPVVPGSFTAAFTFSEPVEGFELGDIWAVNAAASDLSGSGASYSATITPAADGTVVVRVPADRAGAALDSSPNDRSNVLVRTRGQGSGVGVDTWDRSAVLASYRAEFGRVEPASGFTGSVAACTAGTTSAAFRASVLQRVNWYRRMAGVGTVTEDAAMSATAQQKALIMLAQQQLSHTPDSTWACYVELADATENLGLGAAGTGGVSGYMRDPGAHNHPVEHRRNILSPYVTSIGTGDVFGGSGEYQAANAMHFGIAFDSTPAARELRGFVAWPAPGYAPAQTVWGRWSFSKQQVTTSEDNNIVTKLLAGPDFSGAAVAVSDDDGPVAAAIINRDGALVWAVGGDTDSDLLPAPAGGDHCYKVTVSGVVIDGETQDPYEYAVCVIDPAA